MGPVGWGAQGGSGYPSSPPPTMVLGDLVLLDATVHEFAAAMQGVAVAGVVT